MKTSIPIRLYAGLALAVILVLIVGFVSISSLERQDSEVAWVRHTHQVITQLRDTRYVLVQMRGSRRAYWITEDDQYLDNYEKGLAIIPRDAEDLKATVADNAYQRNNAAKLDSAMSTLLAFWKNKGKVVKGQTQDQFKQIIVEEEKTLAYIFNLFEQMKSEEERLLLLREIAVKESNSKTKIIIISGIALLLVVVLLLINAILSTLKSRYKAALKLSETLEQTEKLNAIADEKNWILQGVTFVNDEQQTATSLSELSLNIINGIVAYSKVPTGVFYLIDDNSQLNLVASVGINTTSQPSFAPGEGIVGAASQKKEMTLIEQVPQDYWKVSSGLGAVTGKGELLFMPLYVGNELKGLLELGSFKAFEDRQIQLIKSIANNIAIGINAHQAKEKITNLLEQVQEQKEALISQQEELRQTNEELSRQTEELQASEEELKTQEEELRQINTELQDKNEAVETAKEVLALKAKELEVTSKYKSEFLANMSHELRTPLNSVLILARLLADNNNDNLTPKQVEYANIIHKSGSDLLQLINDILDLSKIEAGKIDLTIEPVTIDSVATDVQQLFSVIATEKQITFKTDIAPGTPASILTDKQRAEQVLKNLLSNAFKFTPKGGSITLAFTPRIKGEHHMLAMSVIDSGIGIPPEKQQLIFEAFQQADGSTSRKFGGTGLGLSISKELANLLNGEIEVFSEPGKGSTFTLLLPYEFKQQHKSNEFTTEPALSPVSVIASVPSKIVEQVQVADDKSEVQPKDKVMLIIEDDPNFASIVRDFAQSKGYKCIIALQGDEGLHYARKYKPSAIILDIQLPVIDGWSLLKIFKEDEKLKDIPVHIISAFDDNRLHSSGALAYIKKPINKESLENVFSTIGSHIEEHFRRVLMLSPTAPTDEAMEQLFKEKHHNVQFEHVNNLQEAFEFMEKEKYDCVIADIGKNIQPGIDLLQKLKIALDEKNIPLIIYLDADMSSADEMQLKKLSDVIIRSSSSAGSRLMDELELFLYKVQEGSKKQEYNPATTHTHDTSLSGKHVLLVDDDMRNVFALTTLLETQDMQVITAGDGKEAVDLLQQHPETDIVLMDIMMPEMDGYEAMRYIRKELKLTNLPVIALTAKAMSDDREKSIEAGASDYITKPVDVQKLLSLLRIWLAR